MTTRTATLALSPTGTAPRRLARSCRRPAGPDAGIRVCLAAIALAVSVLSATAAAAFEGSRLSPAQGPIPVPQPAGAVVTQPIADGAWT
jgi:hypothetical protein